MPTYKYLNDTGLERTLSKLKAYIDSQSGGGSDGHGFIICDTSTMQVGDKIRVRSVYTVLEEQYNQTKEVVTVGQPVVFTVPCYDYYKICTVQTIDNTPTEIGGVYKTVDYGQTLFINVLDKTTLGGIQGILNAHQEGSLLAIGDEVTITVNGADWVMQIAGINVYHDHDIMFTSKHIWSTEAPLYTYTTSPLRTKAQLFYADIDANDKQFIKEVTRQCRENSGTIVTYNDYCFVLGNKETINNTGYGTVPTQVQMPLFVTQANRVKTYNDTAFSYWTSDSYGSPAGVIYIVSDGSVGAVASGNLGVVPSFMLIADS